MKQHLSHMILCALLTACAIPESTQPTPEISDNPLNIIEKKEDNIIAYYTENGKLTETPQENGYYRKLLERTAEGYAVVQDFYQKTHQKQSNTIVITDEKYLRDFDSRAAIKTGKIILYAPNGDIAQFFHIENGVVLLYRHYLNGQVAMEIHEFKDNQWAQITAYYDNGKPMIQFIKNPSNGQLSQQYYTQDGVLFFNSEKMPKPAEMKKLLPQIQEILAQYFAILKTMSVDTLPIAPK